MSRYLARLKTLLHEKPLPVEPSKPSKTPYEGFEGDKGSRFFPDKAAIDERAGLAADRVPAPYLDAWARLNCQKPFDATEADWRSALDDGGRFLDAWGNDAAALGWTPGDLFDVSAGLVWRLAGRRAHAIGPDHVRLSDGARLFVRRTIR